MTFDPPEWVELVTREPALSGDVRPYAVCKRHMPAILWLCARGRSVTLDLNEARFEVLVSGGRGGIHRAVGDTLDESLRAVIDAVLKENGR